MDKNQTKWIVAIIVVALIVAGVFLWLRHRDKSKLESALVPDAPGGDTGATFTPGNGNRPERNNNPFNLKLTNLAWTGKVPKNKNTDGTFEQFYEKKFGIRAGLKNIINKVARGKNTLNTLIPVYAPSSENNTGQYIQQISQWTGFDPSEAIPVEKDNMLKLASAIARKEGVTLTDSEISEGYNLI